MGVLHIALQTPLETYRKNEIENLFFTFQLWNRGETKKIFMDSVLKMWYYSNDCLTVFLVVHQASWFPTREMESELPSYIWKE